MGIFFDVDGNQTNEEPHTQAEWKAHFAFKRAYIRTHPEHQAKVNEEIRSLLADKQRKDFETKVRSAYIRNGGHPKDWDSVKDVIIKTTIEQATREDVRGIARKTPVIKF